MKQVRVQESCNCEVEKRKTTHPPTFKVYKPERLGFASLCLKLSITIFLHLFLSPRMQVIKSFLDCKEADFEGSQKIWFDVR